MGDLILPQELIEELAAACLAEIVERNFKGVNAYVSGDLVGNFLSSMLSAVLSFEEFQRLCDT